jgi:methylaspartate ammonia-lyase
MIRIPISKVVNIKWLTRELQAAGVNVSGVGAGESGTYAEVAEVDEAAALAVIQAHDPENTPDVLEKADLAALSDDIDNQINWIGSTIPEIDTGLGTVGAFANATQRAIITGLLQNQKRELQIIRGILKAFRFIVRKLLGAS